jgi:alkylation response protein AidB-like acyl-CoA dehydrogenase
VGRTVAPVPLATDGVARLFLAEHGHAPSAGIYSCAIAEEHDYAPSVPTTTVTRDRDDVVVTGTKYLVPAATVADRFLVTAASPDGSVVVLLGADEVTVKEQRLSDGDAVGLLEIDARVPADRVIDGAARLVDLATVATCAVQLGVVEGAVRLTAEYAKTREQFDRPIGTFQAVAQRLADGYIDMRMQALTVWQAAWRLAEGLPAEEAVATAKLWAADAGHRVAHTTVHIHGGVGIDLDGEAHRYFTAAKRYELEHGSATDQALRLGRLLAAGPA